MTLRSVPGSTWSSEVRLSRVAGRACTRHAGLEASLRHVRLTWTISNTDHRLRLEDRCGFCH